MSLVSRSNYYRRILSAYLGPGSSQLAFWHETPEVNPLARSDRLGEYYMTLRQKADYGGPYDSQGIPMLDYRGVIGRQYNPIAIAQWGLANYNRFLETHEQTHRRKVLRAGDWLCQNLEQNAHGVWVWNHQFDWEYREILKAPWFSGLAQGQGVSLLLRVHAMTAEPAYLSAAECAFVSLTRLIDDGGVLFEDDDANLWIEEYLVSPPTHILNGFIWALWGVFDCWLARKETTARNVFDRGAATLSRNLDKYDTGYWSLYEQSGTRLQMLASPFYHQLHTVQLRVMAKLTGNPQFEEVAQRWEGYARQHVNRTRAWVEKSAFKLLYY
jgi:heparosan-N-sulfate-glucuronate 5-epimerase